MLLVCLTNDLTIVVYNFVDMISHARTDMNVIKSLASDEKAYRSLTKTWFLHAPLFQLLKKLSQKKCDLGTFNRPWKFASQASIESASG